MVGPWNAATTCSASAGNCDATVSAQGRPAATSAANEGPDSTPHGNWVPSSCWTTWCGSSSVSCSRPLHNHTSPDGVWARSWRATGRRPATEVATTGKAAEVSLWQEKAHSQEHALVLKDNDQIQKYVLSIVKNYFRTTKKAKVSLDSVLTEHGLDSLDVIELVIQVEDELGYVIDADNLNKFKKPKHFVNFIAHMESYKSEFHKLPHEGNHAEFSFRAAFPGLPGEKKEKAHH